MGAFNQMNSNELLSVILLQTGYVLANSHTVLVAFKTYAHAS